MKMKFLFSLACLSSGILPTWLNLAVHTSELWIFLVSYSIIAIGLLSLISWLNERGREMKKHERLL